MSRPECRMGGCAKESRGRGLCSTHWLRWRNHGDPNVVKVSGVDYNVKPPCSVDGCDRLSHGRGYCNMHLRRVSKHGDPAVLGQTGRPLIGDVPTWHAIHKRLSRTFGPAREQLCIDCAAPAREWSYNGLDCAEIAAPEGRYSLNLAHYDPRCVSCHRKFDGAGKRPRTSSGTFAPREAPRV